MNQSVTGYVPPPGSCLPGPGYVGVGISNANRSVTGFTGCVPAPGGSLRGPGVCQIGNSNLGRFGLAPFRGPSRRVCPGLRVYASAPTTLVTTGISFGIWSGPVSDLCGRQSSTSVSAVSLSTRITSVSTILSSPSDCSRLIFWLRTSGLLRPLSSAPHRYPGMKIPGHGHQIVAVMGADNNTDWYFITFLLQQSVRPVAGIIPN